MHCLWENSLLDPGCADGKEGRETDLYEVLGVTPSATPALIRAAYRHAATRTHPDKRPARFADRAAQQTALLNHAYSVLKDPELRRDYDEQRFGAPSSESSRSSRRRHEGNRKGGFAKALTHALRAAVAACGRACAGMPQSMQSVLSTLATAGALLARLKRRHKHAEHTSCAIIAIPAAE